MSSLLWKDPFFSEFDRIKSQTTNDWRPRMDIKENGNETKIVIGKYNTLIISF